MICKKCGCRVNNTASFCDKCGAPMAEFGIKESKNAEVQKGKGLKTRLPIFVVIALVCIAALGVFYTKVAPKFFRDAESYMAEGDYQTAYEKAKTDTERNAIFVENLAAVQSADAVLNLKFPTSFVLNNAYYWDNDGDCKLVLDLNAENSFGESIVNYWMYSKDTNDGSWQYICAFGDLEEEEKSEWDSDETAYRKIKDNSNKRRIQKIMLEGSLAGSQVDKNGIKRINDMAVSGTLDAVKLLNTDNAKTK